MRTTKKALSIVLAGLMTVGGMSVFSVSAAQTSTPTLSFKTQNALYAHAVSGSDDSDAWVAWQCKHNEDMEELNTNRKYFFLPSSVSSTSVELYNAYSKSVTVNNVTIPSGESREVSYTIDQADKGTADGTTYSLTFLKSSAESAIYVNNSNADGNGKELISYLNEDKSNYSSATGAIVDRNGKIDNTSIKKSRAEATQHGARLRSLTTSHIPIRFQSAVCQRAKSSLFLQTIRMIHSQETVFFMTLQMQ